MLLEESRNADSAMKLLVRALRRLNGLPGNLELMPHSVLRNLFEEVGWEEEFATDPHYAAGRAPIHKTRACVVGTSCVLGQSRCTPLSIEGLRLPDAAFARGWVQGISRGLTVRRNRGSKSIT